MNRRSLLRAIAKRAAAVSLVSLVVLGALAWALAPAADLAAKSDALDPPVLRLDEEIVVRTRGAAAARLVTVRRRDDGAPAAGRRILGRLFEDRMTQRRVVVQPEAVRDYYMLIRGLSREVAAARARRLLRSLERAGRLRRLDRLDAGLRDSLGPNWGAGTRLDEPAVHARFPPTLQPSSEFSVYRRAIAGDDDLWRDHFLDQDFPAFEGLRADERFERFHVPLSAAGVPTEGGSVLRRREWRRVLVHRNRRYVTFVPDIPQQPDASDTAYEHGAEYLVRVRAAGARRVLSGLGEVIPRRLFSVVEASSEQAFAATDERVGETNATTPRVINVTPPNGELFVMPETDWEWPDNILEVPPPARRPFVVRLRFSHPLDPRTVSTSAFRVERLGTLGVNRVVFTPPEPVTVTVELVQTRLGNVEVTLTPTEQLTADSEYRVVLSDTVRSLGGAPLARGFASSFATGAGPEALEQIQVRFLSLVDRLGEDGFGPAIGVPGVDPTTALWPAPEALDPEREGRVVPDPALMDSVGYSRWFDTYRPATVLRLRRDDPLRPGLTGTSIYAPDNGATVEVVVRTAPEEPSRPNFPNSFLVSDWVSIDLMSDELPPGRFVQFRIDFHLPPTLPPDAELPHVSMLWFDSF